MNPLDNYLGEGKDGSLFLKKPLSAWPPELRELYREEITALFPEYDKAEKPPEGTYLLCLEATCQRSPAGERDAGCLFYLQGVCTASVERRDLRNYLRFFGVNEKKLYTLRAAALKSWLEELASVPEFMELLDDLHLGNFALPQN